MNKNSFFPITIPVKPYVKQFIDVEYGKPAYITRRDIIGNKLYDILHRRYFNEKIQHGSYSAQLKIYISKNLFRYAGCDLTMQGIVAFNSFMELLIKDRQRRFINNYILRSRCEIQVAILAFIDLYQSDGEDFSFEAIKKDYYRWRFHGEGKRGDNIIPTHVPPSNASLKAAISSITVNIIPTNVLLSKL